MDALAHALVTAPGEVPDRWLLVLHGILGSGANWRGFAKRLLAAQPRWGAVLVDLRLHGASVGFAPPHTVASAASDLDALRTRVPGPIAAVLGHSFGGKVALQYTATHSHELSRAWIVDAMPGPRLDAHGSEATLAVLDVLDALPRVLASREAFLERMEHAGVAPPIAQWLAMNVRARDAGYVFRIDLTAARAMVEDYFSRDLWPVVESPTGDTRVSLIIGGRSGVYSPDDRARAERAAHRDPARVAVHVLANAGHWVHVDDPDGLLAIVTAEIA